jgi:hypothetical protein
MGLTVEQHSETWLSLCEATAIIDHDQQKARQRLERAIKKAWLVPSPGLPQPPLDPNVPLRIQVTPPAGLRTDGRAWLDNPALDWEASEVECLCKPWRPAHQAPSSTAEIQCRARIEVWGGDLARLWGGDNTASHAFVHGNDTETACERWAEAQDFSHEIYGY